MNINDAVAEVETALRGAGLAASADPRQLNPPCAWVSATGLTHELLSGGGTVRLDVYLIAPDHGVTAALDVLSTLLDKALDALDPATETSLNEAVTLPAGGGPLPAFRLTVEREIC
ncbi:hypothetical protein PQC61_gp12 [Gordonia phage Emperor]|uniref:Uncharacterized protein n=2 Tax=root TaxID=1 RepID=A0A2Z4Q5C2_9CAUD|nr:hypothetical protein [Gordonia westfalica]YP_010674609.1 hypothetical protein PQC61_gp12 [Gordonia phage Emperor]AWY04758.1 hypothetical protein PBI_EMPEROR_12 [Gordonia phage Emperor]SDU50426.1 hypothetical protein SAMN04488548_1341651 [Gordonia westfalica]